MSWPNAKPACIRSVTLILLLAAALSPPVNAQDESLFGQDAIDAAITLTMSMPGYDPATMGPVTIEQSAGESSDYAEYNHNTNTLTLFPKTFLADRTFDCLKFAGLNGNVAAGALVGALYHELLHKCYGSASSAMENGCWNEYRSCPHLAIDYATHTALCQMAETIISENCPDDPGDCSEEVTEELVGICEAIQLLEEKWNNQEGAAIVAACRSNPPCELPMGTNCPTGNSLLCAANPNCSSPDPSPYPPDDGDTNVMGPCEACGDFSN